MRRLAVIFVCFAVLSIDAFAQDDHNDAGTTKVGYAIVTATSSGGGLAGFETLGFRSQVPALQAGVLPATMTSRLNLYASASIRVSLSVGVAITNPASTPAVVTMTLRDTGGNLTSSNILTVGARQQTAKYISEFFVNVPNVPQTFEGTLTLTSDTPVGILALLFSGTTFSTIPITSLSPTVALPQLTAAVGGSNGLLLPQFVADGGWASEIVVLNTGSAPLTVRIDLFQQDSTPLVTTLNHQLASTFQNLVVAPGGIIIFAPRNANGDTDF